MSYQCRPVQSLRNDQLQACHHGCDCGLAKRSFNKSWVLLGSFRFTAPWHVGQVMLYYMLLPCLAELLKASLESRHFTQAFQVRGVFTLRH